MALDTSGPGFLLLATLAPLLGLQSLEVAPGRAGRGRIGFNIVPDYGRGRNSRTYAAYRRGRVRWSELEAERSKSFWRRLFGE